MRRVVLCFLLIMIGVAALVPTADAAKISDFDSAIEGLRDSLSDEVKDKMDSLGIEDIDSSSEALSISGFLTLFMNELTEAICSPLSACLISVAMIVLASLLEGCTFSLRHTDTREILSVVTALLLIGTLVTPIAELIRDAITVITAGADIMLVYLPLMVGIMSFSGHIIPAGGYYVTVLTASEAVSQCASSVFSPMLNGYLALSAASSFGGRLRLHSFCELFYSVIRWGLVFIMTVYTAVLSLQTMTANAADTAAARAARFTLSSFIPMVGGAISEAYKTISGSIDLLRSGLGVFVIMAVLVAFMPVIIRAVLWQTALKLAMCTAQALGTESPAALLSSLSAALSAMLALTISSGAVFVISTAALMQIGGSG